MTHDADIIKSLDRLTVDLNLALTELRDSGQGSIPQLFVHVREPSLGKHSRAWAAACMLQLADRDIVIYDGSDDFVLLASKDDLSIIINDQFKTGEIVTKAYDSVFKTSIWDLISSVVIEASQKRPVIDNSLTTIESLPVIDLPITIEKSSVPNTSDIELDNDRREEYDGSDDWDGEEEDDGSDDGEEDQDELSWEDNSFSEDENRTLSYVREAMEKLASGGKWSRMALFPDQCDIGIPFQREILKSAVRDGLLQQDGQNRGRKYWLSPDRDDHDSFTLISKLVYPDSSDLINSPDSLPDTNELLNGNQALIIENQALVTENIYKHINVISGGVSILCENRVTRKEFDELKASVDKSNALAIESNALMVEILSVFKSGRSNGN